MKIRQIQKVACDFLTGTKYSYQVAISLWTFDLFLSIMIIHKIPYTEIDWKAYMEQVSIYLKGERNYAKIRGGTGPLVYPAGHVYIFSALYRLTDNGENIFRAQRVFLGLYMATLALVMRSYIKSKAPLYSFVLLVLSKRLHSIYMLRLFNDTFAIFVTYVALSLWQDHFWLLGSALFSFAISIKMNVLLFLPAVAILLLQTLGPKAFRALLIMLQVQIIVAYPFTSKFFVMYIARAFQFNRVFLYKWTVNWRFVDEKVFLSHEFAQTLLIVHALILVVFILTRWLKLSNMSVIEVIQTIVFPFPRPANAHNAIIARVSPDYVLKTFYTCNLIGVLCARSLHYQFYSWFAWSLPFLLSMTGWNPMLQLALWAAEEWAWNKYPSTGASSLVVVVTNAVILSGVWLGTKNDFSEKLSPEMATVPVTESTPAVPAPSFQSATKPTSRNQKRRRIEK
ncbi:glycosyltransferase [Lipomyces arxii]|uniref:glycosyltransferase n=1 Tax=Lipomyces arxii TaxID=56418 RepID=UPI0034CDBFAF